MPARLVMVLSLVCFAAPWSALAEDPIDEAARLYEVEISATPKLSTGAAGQVVVRIEPKPGAEIHKTAPISLTLEGQGVQTAKKKLGRAELTMEGENASFTVPFTGETPGPASIDAQLTFYVCTDNVCARQQRQATLPITIERSLDG